MDEISQNGHNGKSLPQDVLAVVRPPAEGTAADQVPGWLVRWPWVPLVVPFVVYMVCGTFEPTESKPFELAGLVIKYADYPKVYTVKVLLTLASIAAVWPGYREFSFRVTPLGPIVGAIGVVLWIGICKLNLEKSLLAPLGLDSILGLGERSAFNPLEQMADQPLWAYTFLAIRFLGLVAVVPLIEEFFLRGFVMRFVVDGDWWKVPFGTLTPAAIIAGSVLPMLLHPGELFAAAAWFTLVTGLMFLTKSIWDCIVAHGVTNALLGAWVLMTDDWQLM